MRIELMVQTDMQFRFVDHIVEFQNGVSITAERQLRPDEQYLEDHFPGFPVMPGVLMLETMFQTAAWLVRRSEDFANAVVVLKEARNIKYAEFVQPGNTLRMTAQILKQDDRFTTLKGEGTVDGKIAVSGRLVIERFNQASLNSQLQTTDEFARQIARREFDRLSTVSAV